MDDVVIARAARANLLAEDRMNMDRVAFLLVGTLFFGVELVHAQGAGFADQLAAAEAIWKRAPLRS
jgi:hypothetical protein